MKKKNTGVNESNQGHRAKAAGAGGVRRGGGGGARRTRFPPEKHICDSVLSISELEMLSTPSLNLRGVQVQIFKEHMSK